MADQVAHLAHLNSVTPRSRTCHARRSPTSSGGGHGWAGRFPGTRSPTASTPISAFDEWHGTNAFFRDDGDRIFRTYFVNSRGDEALGSAWAYLDLTALGRQETWEDSPEGYPQTEPYLWWNLHDEYDTPTVHEAARAALADSASAGSGRGLMPAPADTLRIERTYRAPAEAVLDAWTSEEVMRRWWHAEHDWETTEAEVDLRVGGVVRVVMRDPGKDAEYGGGGRYTEIDRRTAWRSPGYGTATTPAS